MKLLKKIILILFVLLSILLTACSKKTEPILFHGELYKGIFYRGKIYWQTDVSYTVNGEKIGIVKDSSRKGSLPVEEFQVTDAAKFLVGNTIYFKDESLYIEHDGCFYIFQYITEMPLEEEIPLNSNSETEGMPVPNLVYKNLYYQANGELSIEKIPNSFYKGGETKKICLRAAENYAGGGIPVGTKFYVSDIQNRYIIVEHKDNSYSVFENLGYLK